MKQQSNTRGWMSLFSLWVVQGVAAALITAIQPADSENALMLGLSAGRWAVVGLSMVFTLFASWLAWRSRAASGWPESQEHGRAWRALWIGGIVAILVPQATLAIVRGLSQAGSVFLYTAYADRLAPLLNLLALCGLELVVWMIWLRRATLVPAQQSLSRALLIWLALGAVLAFVALTGIGVQREHVGVWARPTVPFWEWQIVLVWVVGAAVWALESSPTRPLFFDSDRGWAFAIWVVVSVLWLSQPINIGWLAGPRPPNFDLYPFSDALNYDQYAQSILIGNGLFGSAIPQRPLYIVFLAALHAIAGQDYARVIAAQTLVLALFPVTLFLIGREISGRPLGIMLAAMATLRDLMTNLAADYGGNFSFSKFYLSELPTALLLGLATLFLIRGVKKPGWNLNFALAGGLFGLGVLVRTQVLLLVPPVLLVAFLGNRAAWRDWLRAATLLVVMIAITVAPWVWRNWRITGAIVLDDPATQMSLRALNYHGENGVVEREPGEGDGQYSSRLVAIAISGVRENPALVTRLIGSHFLNNELGNLLVFPVRDGLQSLAELFRPTRAFWEQVDLDFTAGQASLLVMYLLLLSIGVDEAWRTAGWAGLLPLAMNLAYNFSLAMFMSSGMRFLLVADWGFYLYYALGLLVIARGVLSGLGWIVGEPATFRDGSVAKTRPVAPGWRPLLLAGFGFFVLGSSIPLSEALLPDHYPPLSRTDLIQRVEAATAPEGQDEVAALVRDPDVAVLQGRVLYPRFYAAGEGETEKLGYRVMPQDRLVFAMVGEANSLVIMELPAPPEFFPHAADMILLARREPQHLQALAVLVIDAERSQVYFASGR